jgi:hypothetical protein
MGTLILPYPHPKIKQSKNFIIQINCPYSRLASTRVPKVPSRAQAILLICLLQFFMHKGINQVC